MDDMSIALDRLSESGLAPAGYSEKFDGPGRASSGTQRNYYALASIVRDALRHGGRVQIICFWIADSDLPLVEPKIQLVPARLEDAAFVLPGRRLVEVAASSDPTAPPGTALPDRPEFKVAWGPWIFWFGVVGALGIAFHFPLAVLLGVSILFFWLADIVKSRELRSAWLTDLMICAADGDLGRVRELIEGGAEVHARDASGETALIHAARGGRCEIVEQLLSAGADPLVRADSGSSASDVAQSHRHAEAAALLRRRMDP
ncbi:MAG: ankyrin repeat domain-containing protein [Burkholderiales bacterium]|nr:ankyrin repeat domain-containing protein [Burkholderiales bacterium]